MSFSMKKHLLIHSIIILSQIILIQSPNPNDIKRRIQSEIESLNNDELLEKILRSGGLSDCDSNFCYQISYIDSQYVKNQEMKYPQIILSNECKLKLKAAYEASNLIITKIFVKKIFDKDSTNYKAGINGISDVIFYQIFPYVNKRIVLYPINPEFSCGKNVIHYNPLYIDNETLKKKIIDIFSQNEENEDNLTSLKDFDILDPNSNFYNDRCSSLNFIKYNSNNKDNTNFYDMSLSQRKKYYFPGNLQLCPVECEYLGVEQKTLSILCQCQYEEFTNIKYHNEYKEFDYDKDNFKNSKKDSVFNFNIIKCSKLIFTSKGIKGIKDNYGCYIILLINFMIFIYYILLMYYKNNHIISLLYSVSYDLREQDKIKYEKKIMKNEIDTELKKLEDNKSDNSKTGMLKSNKISIEAKKEEEAESEDELKEHYEQKIKEIISQKDNEIQLIIKRKDDEIIQLKESRRSLAKKGTNLQMDKDNVQFELQPQVIDINKDVDIFKAKNEESEEIVPLELKFSNEEINNMDFQSSIHYDNRNICDIYGSYLNEKTPLIFLFNCNSPSSISTYIKLITFFKKMLIYFLINSLFFGSEIITKIYNDKFGFKEKLLLCLSYTPLIMILNSFIHNLAYNTFYQKVAEVKILYYNSNISSKLYFKIIKNALGYFTMGMDKRESKFKENMSEEEKQKKAILSLAKSLFRYFRDKICIKFFIVIIWMTAVCYMVTVFGAAFKNSQMEFFKTVLISFIISNIIPFIYCLILAILRKIAISGESKCFYYITKIFRIL